MEKTVQKKRGRIALLIETSNSYARGLLRGIRDYEKFHKSWSIFLAEHSRGKPDLFWLNNWEGDGIIARIENEIIADAILESGLPAVDLSAGRYIPNLIWVETNDKLVAKLAAEHLTNCGLRNFAYCGDPYFNWSKWRQKHFEDFIYDDFGYKCFIYELRSQGKNKLGWLEERDKMSEWLLSLPKPIGIMACYDICGQQVIEACRSVGINVPDEVAVIGVDNDNLLCELSDPPLSSVITDPHQTGYLAAELLDRILGKEKIFHTKYLIDPIGVVGRQSTNVLSIEDKYVSDAIKFINENIDRNIKVQDVLAVIPLSRRVFEKRFYKELSRTPKEEITRIKLLEVGKLLIETDLTLFSIAEKTGFKHLEHMSSLFKRKIGISPSHYRVKYRYHKYPTLSE